MSITPKLDESSPLICQRTVTDSLTAQENTAVDPIHVDTFIGFKTNTAFPERNEFNEFISNMMLV